jgi:glutaredoxin
MNRPPPLPVRVCPRHGLVAGPDGRCVICHRGAGHRSAKGSARALGGVALVVVAIGGGAVIWKGARQRALAPPRDLVQGDARANGAAPTPTAPVDDPGPTADEQAKQQERRLAEQDRSERAVEAEVRNVGVVMYTVKKCEMCDAARTWMRDKGMAFREVDVEADATGLEAMRKLTPSDQVPVFDVDGEVLVGFGPTTVLGAVRRAADKRARTRF